MAFGAVKPGMPQRQDEKKPPPVWNGDDFFTRSDGSDYPPRRMKETVSGLRRHQLDDAPVCAIHRLDVRGRAAEARLRESDATNARVSGRKMSAGRFLTPLRPIVRD